MKLLVYLSGDLYQATYINNKTTSMKDYRTKMCSYSSTSGLVHIGRMEESKHVNALRF